MRLTVPEQNITQLLEKLKEWNSAVTSRETPGSQISVGDVLSVESKAIEVSRDTRVRMNTGIYKGDLAKVVDIDNVCQKITVKLIPRVDLQAMASKLEGRDVPNKGVHPSCTFINIDEVRELHIRVEQKRDPATGDYFEIIEGMLFKGSFLYKNVLLKSLCTQNVQPSFDELEKFSNLLIGLLL